MELPLKMNSALILTRFRPEHQAAILALHRSAMQGFDLASTRQGRGDLLEIERFYFRPAASSSWDCSIIRSSPWEDSNGIPKLRPN